jgi:hypothetical protein
MVGTFVTKDCGLGVSGTKRRSYEQIQTRRWRGSSYSQPLQRKQLLKVTALIAHWPIGIAQDARA